MYNDIIKRTQDRLISRSIAKQTNILQNKCLSCHNKKKKQQEKINRIFNK
jgi:nitrate reductase cytochrome c-type subunit